MHEIIVVESVCLNRTVIIMRIGMHIRCINTIMKQCKRKILHVYIYKLDLDTKRNQHAAKTFVHHPEKQIDMATYSPRPQKINDTVTLWQLFEQAAKQR